MKASFIVESVKDAIEDASFSNEKILSYIQKACDIIAARLAIPELIADFDLVVPQGSRRVALPDDYMKGLFQAYVVAPTFCDVRVEPSYSRLIEITHGFTRLAARHTVSAVSNTLHLSPNFSDFVVDYTIRLFYYSTPPTLKESSSILFIPEQFQFNLLFNAACADCYNLIETGIDSPKINHNKYLGFFSAALDEFAAFIGPQETSPDFIPAPVPHREELP